MPHDVTSADAQQILPAKQSFQTSDDFLPSTSWLPRIEEEAAISQDGASTRSFDSTGDAIGIAPQSSQYTARASADLTGPCSLRTTTFSLQSEIARPSAACDDDSSPHTPLLRHAYFSANLDDDAASDCDSVGSLQLQPSSEQWPARPRGGVSGGGPAGPPDAHHSSDERVPPASSRRQGASGLVDDVTRLGFSSSDGSVRRRSSYRGDSCLSDAQQGHPLSGLDSEAAIHSWLRGSLGGDAELPAHRCGAAPPPGPIVLCDLAAGEPRAAAACSDLTGPSDDGVPGQLPRQTLHLHDLARPEPSEEFLSVVTLSSATLLSKQPCPERLVFDGRRDFSPRDMRAAANDRTWAHSSAPPSAATLELRASGSPATGGGATPSSRRPSELDAAHSHMSADSAALDKDDTRSADGRVARPPVDAAGAHHHARARSVPLHATQALVGRQLRRQRWRAHLQPVYRSTGRLGGGDAGADLGPASAPFLPQLPPDAAAAGDVLRPDQLQHMSLDSVLDRAVMRLDLEAPDGLEQHAKSLSAPGDRPAGAATSCAVAREVSPAELHQTEPKRCPAPSGMLARLARPAGRHGASGRAPAIAARNWRLLEGAPEADDRLAAAAEGLGQSAGGYGVQSAPHLPRYAARPGDDADTPGDEAELDLGWQAPVLSGGSSELRGGTTRPLQRNVLAHVALGRTARRRLDFDGERAGLSAPLPEPRFFGRSSSPGSALPAAGRLPGGKRRSPTASSDALIRVEAALGFSLRPDAPEQRVPDSVRAKRLSAAEPHRWLSESGLESRGHGGASFSSSDVGRVPRTPAVPSRASDPGALPPPPPPVKRPPRSLSPDGDAAVSPAVALLNGSPV